MKSSRTKIRALNEGRSLLQKYGYNGFSFQDIANTLGIKKPSLYEHFSSKDDLVISILHEYSHMFYEWTLKVNQLPPLEKIRQVFFVFYSFANDEKKVCPVLALITDLKVLSRPVQKHMKDFIDSWLEWLGKVVYEGQEKKVIRKDVIAKDLSALIYGQVMGSQLQSRIKNNPKLNIEAGEMIIKLIGVKLDE